MLNLQCLRVITVLDLVLLNQKTDVLVLIFSLRNGVQIPSVSVSNSTHILVVSGQHLARCQNHPLLVRQVASLHDTVRRGKRLQAVLHN